MLLCSVQTSAVDELLIINVTVQCANKCCRWIIKQTHYSLFATYLCDRFGQLSCYQHSTDIYNKVKTLRLSHLCDVTITSVWQSSSHRCDGRHHIGVMWPSHTCDSCYYTGVIVVSHLCDGHTGVTLERRQLTSVQCVFTALSQLCL